MLQTSQKSQILQKLRTWRNNLPLRIYFFFQNYYDLPIFKEINIPSWSRSPFTCSNKALFGQNYTNSHFISIFLRLWKVKLSLYLTKYYTINPYPLLNYMKANTYSGKKVQFHTFLNTSLDEVNGQLHSPGASPPGKECGTHLVEGWVYPWTGMNAVTKTNSFPDPARDRTSVFQLVALRATSVPTTLADLYNSQCSS